MNELTKFQSAQIALLEARQAVTTHTDALDAAVKVLRLASSRGEDVTAQQASVEALQRTLAEAKFKAAHLAVEIVQGAKDQAGRELIAANAHLREIEQERATLSEHLRECVTVALKPVNDAFAAAEHRLKDARAQLAQANELIPESI